MCGDISQGLAVGAVLLEISEDKKVVGESVEEVKTGSGQGGEGQGQGRLGMD